MGSIRDEVMDRFDDERFSKSPGVPVNEPPSYDDPNVPEEAPTSVPPNDVSIFKLFKFNEAKYIDELFEYVERTYDEHYSQSSIETMEIAEDDDLGIPYCKMNIIKYARRYGKKGNVREQRKDIMKILHYGLYLLYFHDKEEEKTQANREDYIMRGNVEYTDEDGRTYNIHGKLSPVITDDGWPVGDSSY